MKSIDGGDFGWLKISIKVTTLGLATLSLAVGVQAQTYTAIDLGTVSGGYSSYANGINNRGEVVGYSNISGSVFLQHPFLYSNGTMMDLGTLPGACGCYGFVAATGINNSGQVVGNSDFQNSFGLSHAFLYSGGRMIDLGTLPDTYGPRSFAFGINNSGQVTGWSEIGSIAYVVPHAFLYGSGSMIDLARALSDPYSYAYGINDPGQVVGQSAYASNVGIVGHAFLYSSGRMSDLGTLGGLWSSAFAINNGGAIVGQADTAAGDQYQHAFLYTRGSMTDLGTLAGPNFVQSTALGINNSGQIVGYASDAAGEFKHAFSYSGGTMKDLNDLASLPSGVYLTSANGINDFGQIAANGSDGHAYLLTPGNVTPENSLLTVVNPFSTSAIGKLAPPTVNANDVLNAVPAGSLAADGESAVVLAYQSKSPQPVTFTLSVLGSVLKSGAAVGSLGQFDTGYLANPIPTRGNVRYEANNPTFGPDAAGNYVFLALLWAPNNMPSTEDSVVTLTLNATQQGQGSVSQASIALEPPPLLLVHGIWSSADGSGFSSGSHGFYDWISMLYPHNQIYAVDYGPESAKAFSDPSIQNILLSTMTDALAGAAAAGMSARTVDVVAHSMGGLVTRYLLSLPSSLSPDFLANPVHKLITIGTPHEGTQLAATLFNNRDKTTVVAYLSTDPEVIVWCAAFSACTLGDVFAAIGKPVDGGGVQSLVPKSPQLETLSPSNEFAAIVGQAPTNPLSLAERLLDVLIYAFLPGETVGSILGGQSSDTIVPVSSQSPLSGGQTDSATVSGIVHANLCEGIPVLSLVCSDTGETESQAVWAQAFYWLMGGTGTAPAAKLMPDAAARASTSVSTIPQPLLNLSAYTQVATSNVAIMPTTGSVLTINSTAKITVTSSTKTITEVLLLQTVSDPTDALLLYATQSPFSISFTPARLGSANFAAITVFSDNTYAVTTLSYILQSVAGPYALNLVNAPLANMTVGDSRVIRAKALFTSGPLDVTQVATYTARSGTANVFRVSSGGTITANGNGVDLLDVSYGGVTATAQITVGPCTYALNPSNQIVPNTGGTATIEVTTQAGCAWTGSGGAEWLKWNNASGSGNGVITLTASTNSSGGTQAVLVTLAGLQAFVTQPAIACEYGLAQTQINAPAAGESGMINVTTSCPVIASSNQTWVTATPLGTSVAYTIAPNDGASQRSAILTIGTAAVSVVQAGSTPPSGPSINSNGIVNNGSFAPGGAPVSAGSIAAIFGANLTDGTSCLQPTCFPGFSNGKLNSMLDGAEVTVNGTLAPILYASPTQIGIQVPEEVTGNLARVQVTVGGQTSPAAMVAIAPVAPGIFFTTVAGANLGAINHANGSAVTAMNPATSGELVILYATGLGAPKTAVPTGELPNGADATAAPVTVTIDGVEVNPDFAGLSGCCVGENQVNVRIPDSTRSGDNIPVVLTIDGNSSNTVVTSVRAR